jgi:hypothetical protein
LYTEVSGELHALSSLSTRKQQPVSAVWDAGWTPQPFWTLRRREKFLFPAGKFYCNDQIRQDRMGGEYSSMGVMRDASSILVGKRKDRDHLVDIGIDGKQLKLISTKYDVKSVD